MLPERGYKPLTNATVRAPLRDADSVPAIISARHIIGMLDSLRRQEETLRVNKPRSMLLARSHGFSYAEIAELLGMSESGVRQAVARAEGTPGVEFGAAS